MKKRTLLAIGAIAVIGFTGYNKVHQDIIVNRFPDQDPNLVKKHYNDILKETYAGRLTTNNWTDTDYDNELLRRILTNK